MKLPEHYDSDVLFFFDGRPLELSLYEALFRHMEADFPAASVKVQKSHSNKAKAVIGGLVTDLG